MRPMPKTATPEWLRRGLFCAPVLQPVPARADDDAPMSAVQAALLWRLRQEAGEPRVFDPGLTSRGALCRIAALRDALHLRQLPPHTD